jgi:hypothetical protein
MMRSINDADARWDDDGGRMLSAEERRARQSAEDVAKWEAAFAAARAKTAAPSEGEPDRANAGALVSRAHREEKTSGSPPHAAGPDDRRAGRSE